jgi:signal transduction histidine kinase
MNLNNENIPKTYFAPAERASKEILEFQRKEASDPLLKALLASVDGYIAILNEQRQILACNNQLLIDIGLTDDSVVGYRPGEALKCLNSDKAPGGCGTSEACKQCGAIIAILECQKGLSVVHECLISVDKNGAQETLEFRAKATKIKIGNNDFIVLTLQNIMAEKRRDLLERTFFHDILNTVGGISAWSQLLRNLEKVPTEKTAERLVKLSTRLIDEINSYKNLLEAERGLLKASYSEVTIDDLFDTIDILFKNNPVFSGKTIEYRNDSGENHLSTDKTLLTRVLCNMVKNALEASKEGSTIKVNHSMIDNIHRFKVNNEGEIPKDVAQQIFKRSFSTKSESGRGIGTYSMKLLGEKYLNGKVGFTTSSAKGTTFHIDLPGK